MIWLRVNERFFLLFMRVWTETERRDQFDTPHCVKCVCCDIRAWFIPQNAYGVYYIGGTRKVLIYIYIYIYHIAAYIIIIIWTVRVRTKSENYSLFRFFWGEANEKEMCLCVLSGKLRPSPRAACAYTYI